MEGLIQKSGYIKSGSGGGHYAEYIATREGVELIVTPPPSHQSSGYLEYMAERPCCHGLFSADSPADLEKTMEEINGHTGPVWTFVYSLKREDAHRLVGQLSGGERARLKLAIICLADSNVLVLDEPTNHLDLPSKEVLQQALAEYEGTLIIVSHDRYLLDRVPNRIFAIEQGALHQYKGGYGAYLRAKAELGPERAAAPQPKTESEQKKQYNRGKEQRREDARRRKEYTETETLIHTLEEELEQIKAEMARDSVQNDYQRLQELCALIEEKQGLLDSALERWLTLSEEMGNS